MNARQTSTPVLATALALLLGACKGETGTQGVPGGGTGTGPTSTLVAPGEDPPGIRITVLNLAGGSGPGGNFRPGDRLTVRFDLTKTDGSDWDITEMSRGRALVSGPSFNYNRVLPEVSDLPSAAVRLADGSYVYTFASPLPSTYAAPYNDTASFGAGDGELTGMPLLDGTYTLGLYFTWDFTVDGVSARDADNATFDFLVGDATVLAPREVVRQENCNRCHDDLRAHGGMRRDVTLCLLCHTSGSEDRNTGGATPDTSVDFRVMIHKIHNAAHLPSVLGVATLPDGSRDYAATPQPYQLVGFNSVDLSDVEFPVFPNLAIPMPRDAGYGALGATERGLEDTMRSGVTDCAVCHGDPDGAGPVPAPLQGGLAYSQPTRRACGACHDDIDWTLPYTANTTTMPPQLDDASCKMCHDPSGDPLDVVDGHRHPLLDPAVNGGLNFDVTAVVEGPGADMDGTLDAGERLTVTLTLRDDVGADFDPAGLASSSLVVSGPTANANLLLSTSIPAEDLAGPQPFSFEVAETLELEFLGDSNGGANGEVFATARAPHRNGVSTPTQVWSRAAPAGGTVLAADASANQNFLDVSSAAGFAVDDVIVVDDGDALAEEYLRIQWIDGNRLWFASPAQTGYVPALRRDHALGDTVQVAVLTPLTAGVDYALDAAAGTITELVEFGAAAVVATYTSDFLMPAVYGPPLNDSPDLDETAGEWTGKALASGTYTLSVWGNQNLSVDVFGDLTTYRGTSPPETFDFLVGDATGLEPYDLIASASACYECHQDLYFHGGGRRGFETCLACHGAAGSEDRPRYRASGAPDTQGVRITFREMLHKIHMGEELTDAANYAVVGFGPGGPPNNFSVHGYAEVVFPVLPGGAASCESCHGASTAWRAPTDRDHPTEQGFPVRAWAEACTACHDSAATAAHATSQTFLGIETCALCHGAGKEQAVDLVHRSY